ncbi:MAG: hypothetical protein WC900_01015 [Oscillospiraceae bacterium]
MTSLRAFGGIPKARKLVRHFSLKNAFGGLHLVGLTKIPDS